MKITEGIQVEIPVVNWTVYRGGAKSDIHEYFGNFSLVLMSVDKKTFLAVSEIYTNDTHVAFWVEVFENHNDSADFLFDDESEHLRICNREYHYSRNAEEFNKIKDLVSRFDGTN